MNELFVIMLGTILLIILIIGYCCHKFFTKIQTKEAQNLTKEEVVSLRKEMLSILKCHQHDSNV